MGKENKKPETNPFGGFSLLKGEFPPPPPDTEGLDDIQSGDQTIVPEEDGLVDDATEAIKKGDKALEKIQKAQEEALKKKNKEAAKPAKTVKPVDEVSDDTEDTEDQEDEQEPPKNQPPTDDESEGSGAKEYMKTLFEKGILDFDGSEEEDSEEGISNNINKTLQNRIDKYVESLPEDGVKFLEYIQNGGDPKKFHEIYYKNSTWEDFKIDTEDAQKAAVKQSLRLAGESEADIEDMVTEWFDNGTLEKRAKSALVKLQKYEAGQKERLVQEQQREAARQQQEAKEYWDSFKKELYAKEDIKGFKLTPKVKDKLWEFMTVVDKRTGKTAYEKSVEDNKESSYLFAYLAMNNFDASKLEKQLESKVSNKFSAMLKNYNNQSKNRISSGSPDEDYGSDPFAAFKTAK